ncbi:MAG: hypothetical protein ACKVOI_05565 [Dongiaceae bacterium]
MKASRAITSAALLLLAACGGNGGGQPTEATWRMQAERYCADGPYARGTPAFDYCVSQEIARHKRADDSKRLYDSIRNIPTSPPR